MSESIIKKILADKRQDVEEKKAKVPLASLREAIEHRMPPLEFSSRLKGDGIKLIAEVKKASPSRGIIKADLDPVELATTYEQSGAAAISVLTEEKHFLGNLEYLLAIRERVNIPLLRKDFIYDEYQVYESAAYGADAILLITGILEAEQLNSLLELSRSLKLDCLTEVHNEAELTTALLAGAMTIGINNRNLETFDVDINTTRRLRLLIPAEYVVVSESGIKSREDVNKMRECKVNAILAGEALVTAEDIPAKIKEMLS